MSSRAESAPPVVVVAAISVGDPEAVPKTLAAVRRQVYEAARIVLIGGDSDVRRIADTDGIGWYASLPALLGAAAPEVSHVWVVRAGARPRPDALQALVLESERNGAAIAGSKLLHADNPEQLISVGLATDVFGTPYVGLDEDEIDFGQYDVVRDVAAVPAASILMRKDLAKGVDGPDPRMAPIPGAVDLCQRARLRGARVIVVPSSEVLIDESRTRDLRWREEAGRIRAMIKAYSWLTLLWALPISFLIGLVTSTVSPFLGRFTAFSWLAAWLWNLAFLPSTLRGRSRARRGRVGDDAELFRYQLRGSAEMRATGGEVSARLRDRLGLEEGRALSELGRDLRQPAFIVGLLAVLFAMFSTRSIWGGALPAVGFSLPLPESAVDTLRSYAGGWNPAGMGSVEPLRPFFGLAGVLQVVLLGNPRLTMSVLVVGAALSGLWGTVRLLRAHGIETVPALFGAGVLIAGPASRSVMDDTAVTVWLAIGFLPWALRIALARWPEGWRARLGRVAAAGWVTAGVAMLSPVVGLVPIIAALSWALVAVTDRSAWRAVLVTAVGTGLAVPVLLPWIATADLDRFLGAGAPAFWVPTAAMIVAIGAALLGTVVSAPSRLAAVAIWGGLLTTLGAAVARSGDAGFGREVEHAGLALVSLGSAAIVAATFETLARVDAVVGWRRFVAGTAAVAAVVVVGSTFLVMLPGRMGLPGDQLGRAVGFTAAASGDPASARILLVGPPDSLPGDTRSVRGAAYRVVSAPAPTLDEAWLAEPTGADRALASALEDIVDGETFRAGELLADFGIRWVIALGDTPFASVFAAQLDLVALGTSDGSALTFDGPAPVRAVDDDGTPWALRGGAYVGQARSEGRVVIAETANGRWGEQWSQNGWANEASAADGVVAFDPISGRRTQAIVAGAIAVLLIAVSFAGRRYA